MPPIVMRGSGVWAWAWVRAWAGSCPWAWASAWAWVRAWAGSCPWAWASAWAWVRGSGAWGSRAWASSRSTDPPRVGDLHPPRVAARASVAPAPDRHPSGVAARASTAPGPTGCDLYPLGVAAPASPAASPASAASRGPQAHGGVGRFPAEATRSAVRADGGGHPRSLRGCSRACRHRERMSPDSQGRSLRPGGSAVPAAEGGQPARDGMEAAPSRWARSWDPPEPVGLELCLPGPGPGSSVLGDNLTGRKGGPEGPEGCGVFGAADDDQGHGPIVRTGSGASAPC
jgi:hypothetical protein